MRQIPFFTILFALLFTVSAQGDFTGFWVGTGQAWDSTGWKKDCETANYEIYQTANELRIESGGYVCGELSTSWDPVSVEIRNGELWFENEKVGTIGPDFLHVKYTDGSMTAEFNVKLEGVVMIAEEKWSSDTGLLVIKGTLREESLDQIV